MADKAQKSMDSLESVANASGVLSSQLGYEPGSSICRNPRQILQFSKRMTPLDGLPGGEAKAQSLLLQCNLEKFNRNLNSISIKKNFEPSVTRLESLDLGSYLKHTRDLIICTAIEESNNATANRFYEEFMHGMKEEWEGFKREASGQLGQCGPGDVRRGRKTQIFDPSCPTLLDFSVGHHFTIVQRMNQEHDGSMTTSPSMEVLEGFKNLSVDVENHNTNVHQFPPHDSLFDSWCLLDRIKGIHKEELIEESRRHLENQFFDKVVKVINQSPRQAMRGGQFGGSSDIDAYLHLEKERYRDFHPWVEVFLLLRSGLREQAFETAKEKTPNGSFIENLNRWIKNMDCTGFMGDDYHNNNNNGWQSAVYYVMGRGSARDECASQVFNTIEDVVWSVLSRRDNGVARIDLLAEIQKMGGPAHFGDPVLYFSVLLLLQEYTEAVKYMYFESGSEDLVVEAVHMGVVLYRCGLLEGGEGVFAEILKDYIRRFSPKECDMALEYLLVLRGEKRVEALTDLLLDSLQFEKLGGTLDPDCNREPGLIEMRVGEPEVSIIFERSAQEACKRGQLASAVKFFFFAGKFDNGLEILCNLLGREIVGSGDLEKRQKFISLAYEYHAALKRGNKCDKRHIMDSLRDLLDLANFFDCARSMRYRDALHIVYNLRLLPPQSSSDLSSVEKFETLTNDVRRNFSEVVVCSMKCLSLLSREAPHREYKQRADAIISFLDKIDYQLSYGALEEIRGLYENGVW